MIKPTLKNLVVTFAILVVCVVAVVAVDVASVKTDSSITTLRVLVVDLDDNPVHNMQVSVLGQTFLTDNKGLSPSMEISPVPNRYDEKKSEWFVVDVVLKKDGFVPTTVLGCVLYNGQTRKLTVKMYPVDNSTLPYVCYVESPPDDFIRELLK